VILVSLLVLKYRVMILLLSDRALIQHLVKHIDRLKERNSEYKRELSKKVITKRVNVILNRLYPQTRCLVRSIVLNEALIMHGHTDQTIKFGLKYENEQMLAHAWIFDGVGFKEIHKL